MNSSKLLLTDIKVSLVGRHVEDTSAYFVKIGVGRNIRKTETRKKQPMHAYYEYNQVEIECDSLGPATILQIDFLKDCNPYPQVVGETEILVDTLLSAAMDQLKLPLICNYIKIGWIYFSLKVEEDREIKKLQYLYIYSIAIEYHIRDCSWSPSITVRCGSYNMTTPNLSIINDRAVFEDCISIPVKLTGMVILEVKSEIDELQSRYASVYFQIEHIRRGNKNEYRLPLSFRNSNKCIGEIVIQYYLQNLHLPNSPLSKTSYSMDPKFSRASTPLSRNSKSLDELLSGFIPDILDEMKGLKYVKKDNPVYKFGMSQRLGNKGKY